MSDILAPGPHKLHKAYLAFFAVKGLRAVTLPFLLLVLSFMKGGEEGGIASFSDMIGLPSYVIVLLFALLIVLIILLLAFISYVRYRWELTESEVRIYKGIIFRKKIRLPFTRINTVDASAKIVERIFGLVSMRIDTAGGSASSADAMVPMLRLDEAEALKAEIFRRRGGAENANLPTVNAQEAQDLQQPMQSPMADIIEFRGAFAGTDSDSVPPEYEHRLSPKEILLTAIANNHAFVGIMIFVGLFWTLYGYAQDIGESVGFDTDSAMERFFKKYFSDPDTLREIIPVIIVVAVIIIVLGYAAALLKKLIAFGGFVIQKRGDRIEVKRGILSRKSSSIVTHRVQTVSLSQSLLMRILGYAEVRAETAGALVVQNNDANSLLEDSVIHPFIRLRDADEFIRRVIPEFATRPQSLEKLTRKALRRSIVRCSLWYALPAAVALAITGIYVSIPSYVFYIAAACLPLFAGLGALRWKGRAIACTDSMLAIREGALSRTLVFIPRRKIQLAAKNTNPFQRRANMATFNVHTAVRSNKRVCGIKDLESNRADEFLEWTEPRGS